MIHQALPKSVNIGDDDDDSASDSSPVRLKFGQVFFEYRSLNSEGMVPAAGIEEMFVYVGVAEEYELAHR